MVHINYGRVYGSNESLLEMINNENDNRTTFRYDILHNCHDQNDLGKI